MFDLNDWLQETRSYIDGGADLTEVRDTIQCQDGFELSVQASRTHYCKPRRNRGPYQKVEVGYPSHKNEALLEYAEDEDEATSTVYPYVPVEVVEEVIEKHGGVVEDEAVWV